MLDSQYKNKNKLNLNKLMTELVTICPIDIGVINAALSSDQYRYYIYNVHRHRQLLHCPPLGHLSVSLICLFTIEVSGTRKPRFYVRYY